MFGAKPLSEKVSRGAFLLYILFLQLASAHHLLVDPGISSEWKVFNTSYAMYLAVLASMIHGLTVPGSIEVAQRAKGYTKGLFEWLRKAPWDNPVFSGMFISLVVFGFIGGISGVVMGTEQINIIIHNTIYVPGHFHATVAVGTTLAFMAVTYLLIPILFRRKMIFGTGQVAALRVRAGHDHRVPVPHGRRHPWCGTPPLGHGDWRVALGFEFPGTAYMMMGLVGISCIVAIIGGALYIYITVGSLLWGKKLDVGTPHEKPVPIPVVSSTVALQGHGSAGFAAPGTFVLAMVFLVAFVLYYFINWKYLSQVWGLS